MGFPDPKPVTSVEIARVPFPLMKSYPKTLANSEGICFISYVIVTQ